MSKQIVVPYTCLYCGVAGTTKPSKPRKFCSIKHKSLYFAPLYTGNLNPNWKGGVCDDGQGRTLIYSPDHPGATKSGYVYEYRLIAERARGSYLSSREVVHHLDGDPSNNDPANLMVMTQAEHAGLEIEQRLTDKNTGVRAFTGVRPTTNGTNWRGRVTIRGKEHHVGTFRHKDNAETAVAFYRELHT